MVLILVRPNEVFSGDWLWLVRSSLAGGGAILDCCKKNRSMEPLNCLGFRADSTVLFITSLMGANSRFCIRLFEEVEDKVDSFPALRTG